MILIRVILSIFLIGLTSCGAQLESDARRAVDAFENALEEFYKIPRKDDFNALTEYFKLEIADSEKRNKVAGELKLDPILKEIRTNILNDQRFGAQLKVTNWCTWSTLFSNMLDTSRHLGETNWEGIRKLQQTVPAILSKITTVMKETTEKLSESSTALHGVRKGTKQLTSMITQVNNGAAPSDTVSSVAPSNTVSSVAPAVVFGLFSMLLAPYLLGPLCWMESVAADDVQNVWDRNADIVRLEAFEGKLGETTERIDNAIAKFQDAIGKFENLENRIKEMDTMPLNDLRTVISNLNGMRRFENRLCH